MQRCIKGLSTTAMRTKTRAFRVLGIEQKSTNQLESELAPNVIYLKKTNRTSAIIGVYPRRAAISILMRDDLQ